MHSARSAAHRSFRLACITLALLTLTWSGPALSADGIREINQTRVTAEGGFPFSITEKGSWILTSDLVVPSANTTAIQIATGDVTLDLNGFSIRGPGTAGDGDGVALDPNNGTVGPVTVRNGIIRGMGDRGIDFVGNQLRLSDLTVSDSGGIGIWVGDAIVSGTRVSLSGDHGILCGTNCVLKDNFSSRNAGDGIVGRGLADGNTVSNNDGDGIDWTPSGMVIGNTSLNNDSVGLRLGAAVGFQNNVSSGNVGGERVGGIDMGNNVP